MVLLISDYIFVLIKIKNKECASVGHFRVSSILFSDVIVTIRAYIAIESQKCIQSMDQIKGQHNWRKKWLLLMMHGIQISDCVDCVPNCALHLYTNILLLLLAYKSLTLSMDKMSASYCAIQIGKRRTAYITHSIAESRTTYTRSTSTAFFLVCLFWEENVWYLACSHRLFFLELFYIVRYQNIGTGMGRDGREGRSERFRENSSPDLHMFKINLWNCTRLSQFTKDLMTS